MVFHELATWCAGGHDLGPIVIGFREAIEATSALLRCLAPCSSNYSAIEGHRFKLKAILQRAKAWTGETLDEALMQSIEHITQSDAKVWFGLCDIAGDCRLVGRMIAMNWTGWTRLAYFTEVFYRDTDREIYKKGSKRVQPVHECAISVCTNLQ